MSSNLQGVIIPDKDFFSSRSSTINPEIPGIPDFLINPFGGGNDTEEIEFSSSASPEFNYCNAVATRSVYDSFNNKISSIDKWTPEFSSTDGEVFKKYIVKYKEKTGIDLYNLDGYSIDELVEKGVFEKNGDFIPDSEILKEVCSEGGYDNYINSGYGFSVLSSWINRNVSVKFDQQKTVTNVKLADIKIETDKYKYVGSPTENNTFTTDESNAIMKTTSDFAASLPSEYHKTFTEFSKTKTIPEMLDENGMLHFDYNEIKKFILDYNSKHPKNQLCGGDEYSISKYANAFTLAANTSAQNIKYAPITEDRHLNGTLYDVFCEEKTFSDASDHDQISLNILNNDLTNGAKEHFGRDSNMYKVYCHYLEGKKVNDIIVDGHFICSKDDLLAASKECGISLSNSEVYNILDYFGSFSVTEYSDSATLRNLTIRKIIDNESGFDSIVFDKGDEIIVTNTCADGDSKEDTSAISYSAIKLLCGEDSDLYDFLAPAFSGNTKAIEGPLTYDDISKAKSVYFDGQLDESYDNVMEQLKSGKKVHINCYSLGGGIGFDTFMRIMADDNISDDVKSRLSFSGYNPYFNMFEQDSWFGDKDAHEEAIKKVFANYGDQIELRCVEGDVVSQFSTIIEGELGNHITYLKPDRKSKPLLSDFDNNIMDLIVNSNSRHSLTAMDENAFYRGYVIENGKKMTMNEILGNKEPSNDLKDIYNGVISPYLDYLKEQDGNEDYASIIDALDTYLEENVGKDIDFDDIIEAISPAISKLVEAEVPIQLGNALEDLKDSIKTTPVVGTIFGIFNTALKVVSGVDLELVLSSGTGAALGYVADLINDEELLGDFVKTYYSSPEGKKDIEEILDIISNDDDNRDFQALVINKMTMLYIQSLLVSGVSPTVAAVLKRLL